MEPNAFEPHKPTEEEIQNGRIMNTIYSINNLASAANNLPNDNQRYGETHTKIATAISLLLNKLNNLLEKETKS